MSSVARWRGAANSTARAMSARVDTCSSVIVRAPPLVGLYVGDVVLRLTGQSVEVVRGECIEGKQEIVTQDVFDSLLPVHVLVLAIVVTLVGPRCPPVKTGLRNSRQAV